MKIVYLNLNYGRNGIDKILNFLNENINADVFCFQEIKDEVKTAIESKLHNFNFRFISKEIKDFGDFNLAIFVNNKYQNISFESYHEDSSLTAPAIFLEVNDGNSKFSILNFHGTPQPGDKLDNEIRINASKGLIEFMITKHETRVIGGDFNLLPNTESVLMFENNGYKNLVKEFNVKTTRNENAWRTHTIKQLFADYIFVSKNTNIKNFEVVDNDISDHLPLILEI